MPPPNDLATQLSPPPGSGAHFYRAPGRVNLIGEHTDYNDGLALPMAVQLSCWLAIVPLAERRVRLYSRQFDEDVEFDLDHPDANDAGHHWSDWARGLALVAARRGYALGGAEMALDSEIPLGAGLSSSAAAAVVTARGWLEESGVRIGRSELAALAQAAEWEQGAHVGLMDPFIAAHGRSGHALLLDACTAATSAEDELRWVALPPRLTLLVANTGVRHDHAGGEYNRRRAECEAAARTLGGCRPGINSLRDVSAADLAACGEALSPVELKRARHVVSENARVEAAVAALEAGDLSALGRLVDESHASLRDDFEVSSPELEALVAAARGEGAYGARLMGGGFGGSVLVLAERDRTPQVVERVSTGYRTPAGEAPQIFLCEAGEGVQRWSAQ